MSNYDRLTALDNSFLLLESPSSYTHVASTLIFESGPLRLEDGGIDFEAIKKAHQAVLHQIPRYRQILQWVPFTQQPVWVDDPHFDLDFHLRHTSLPRPGSERQLKRLSARIMEQHLDRARPLWETWVVEGLEGDRFALVTKVHHCMIDGVSGVDILVRLMDPDPDAPLRPPMEYHPRPRPSGAELLRDEILRSIGLPLQALRDFGRLVASAPGLAGELPDRIRGLGDAIGSGLRPPSETPINQPISPHRRFDWLPMPMDDIKRVRNQLGGSLNDVVLTVVTGAFQRFFRRRGTDPSELDFRVMTPVSMRKESESGTLGNRVSAWQITLPLNESDPRRQLAAISARTQELKASDQAASTEALSQIAEWTPARLLAFAAQRLSSFLPINTVVTNVPGPRVPMYLLGARMLEMYPHVPLVDRLGLGIALMSYDGQIHWGVNADRELVPDVHDFMIALEQSFETLVELADGASS